MEYYYIHYHHHHHSYLTSTLTCENKSYIINKRTSKENIARNMRLMCDLKNKDGLIYSELLKAIKRFNEGKLFHIVSREISKGILKTYDIRHRGYVNLKLYSNKLYYDWDFEFLLKLNEKLFPIIYIEC